MRQVTPGHFEAPIVKVATSGFPDLPGVFSFPIQKRGLYPSALSRSLGYESFSAEVAEKTGYGHTA